MRRSVLSMLLSVAAAVSIGCEERVVRQSGYAPSTPFGTSNVPAQQRSMTQKRSQQPQLSTDWRGTPKISGQQSAVGQPIVPSGSAATPAKSSK